MIRVRSLWAGSCAVALLLGLAGACTSLDDIELGVCGNRVLDPGEDCDGHDDTAAACGKPGTAQACRYICDFSAEAPSCPAEPSGYQCGATNVCARAGDALVRGVDLDVGGDAVVIADFDGDRIADIGVAAASSRELAISFLGAGTSVQAQQVVPVDSNAIATGLVTDDARGDLIVASQGSLLTMSSSAQDRTLVGNASGFISGGPASRLIGVPARAIPEADAQTLAADNVAGAVLLGDAILYQSPFTLKPLPLASFDPPGVTGENLVAFFKLPFYPLTPGADPCDEVVAVRTDTQALTVLALCKDGAPNTDCGGKPCSESAALDAPPVGAFAVDLDADAESEILVVEQGPSIQVFDGATALPVEAAAVDDWLSALSAVPDSKPDAAILAVAFLNDDAALDFVRSDGVFLSNPYATTLTYFKSAAPTVAAPWSEVAVGDFAGGPELDVVASYGLVGSDLELLIGGDASNLSPLVISVTGAVSKLTVGNFDGDGHDDLAFRERASADSSALPACDVSDAIVVRFGAEGPEALADARVLSRGSGVEHLVPGLLPRFDTTDGVTDFAAGTRCRADGEAGTPDLDVTLFYGATNRQVAAPKILIDNLDVGETQVVVPYTPASVASFTAPGVVVAFGEDRVGYAGGGQADDLALFVLATDAGELFKQQHIALFGGDAHDGLAAADFRLAVVTLADGQEAPVVVDSRHFHVVPDWALLAEASDIQNDDVTAALASITSTDIAAGDGLVVEAVAGGDLTANGADDLVIAGQLDGAPWLRVHRDVGAGGAAFDDVPLAQLGGSSVLGVALLPRFEQGAGASAGNLDLVVALEGVGAVVVRWNGSAFELGETLALPDIKSVAVGDVDGDQFGDVVLVAGDRVRVYWRSQRTEGDGVAVSTEEGAQ